MKTPKLYQSQTILSNPERFIKNCYKAHKHFLSLFPYGNSTSSYISYNIFNLTSNNVVFYNFFKELNGFIRSFIGDDRPLWMEAWLNFHDYNKVLKKHGHGFPYHGYISVDPKNTTTVFENFEIKNVLGQVYIGPGGKGYDHYVRVDEEFTDKRITIGFNVDDKPNKITSNLGLIPLI